MTGTSPAITVEAAIVSLRWNWRHEAATYSDPSCPRLSRASTSFMGRQKKDVDGRNKSGHDAERMTIGLLLTTSTLSAVPLRT